MSQTHDPDEVRRWLRRLSWALGGIPAAERADILEEIRAHLSDRIQGGTPPREALAGFGSPETCARRYLDDFELSGALGSQSSGALISVIGRRVHRSLVAALAFLITAIVAAAAFVVVLTAIFKIADPTHAGLWRGSRRFFLGTIDDPAKAHELLGFWIFPMAMFSVTLAWLIGRAILLAALRIIARDRSPELGAFGDPT